MSFSALAPPRLQRSRQVSGSRYFDRVAQSAPREPQRQTNPRPDRPKAGTRSQARGLADTERGVEEALLGMVPRVREPGCRHFRSGGRTHRTVGLSWVVRAAVKA